MQPQPNRIKFWREKAALTHQELADRVPMSRSMLIKLERGERGLTTDWMMKIAKALGIEPGDLLPAGATSDGGATRRVRVIGDVQAGLFRDALEWPPEEQKELMLPVPDEYAGFTVFGLRVKGPSVNEKFPEESMAICVPLIEFGDGYVPEDNKFYVVYRKNEFGETEATIKQLRFDQRGTPWLWPRSNHPDFQTPWKMADLSSGNGFEEEDQDLRLGALVIGKYETL